MEIWVWGLGFGVWVFILFALFGFWVLGSGFWVLGFGFGVLGFGFWVLGFGFWVLISGFWVLGEVSLFEVKKLRVPRYRTSVQKNKRVEGLVDLLLLLLYSRYRSYKVLEP